LDCGLLDRNGPELDLEGILKFAGNFLPRYLEIAPGALALERAIECEIHARNEWPGPILDIGCGDGLFAAILCKEQIDTGIDPETSELECARRTNSYKELIACFGNQIPKPDKSYATIISNSVLEHIPDLLPVLMEANRLLTNEGRFHITIPSARLELATAPARLLSAVGMSGLAIRYGRFYNRFWNHYHAYDDQTWRAIFAEAGFEVVSHRAYVPRDLSTFYDVLTAIALPSLVSKKLLNRWVAWPSMRKIYAGLITQIMRGAMSRLKGGEGCLFFYTLKKRTP
jgi:SAM-dependent methyltransferase